MLKEKERQLLDGPNFIHLATLNADGSPQVSAVWVQLQDDLIIVNTARGRVKERNVSRDPRVAISVYAQDNPYDTVSINGTVVEITEEGARENIDDLAVKYTGKPYQWLKEGETRVIIKIKKA